MCLCSIAVTAVEEGVMLCNVEQMFHLYLQIDQVAPSTGNLLYCWEILEFLILIVVMTTFSVSMDNQTLLKLLLYLSFRYLVLKLSAEYSIV